MAAKGQRIRPQKPPRPPAPAPGEHADTGEDHDGSGGAPPQTQTANRTGGGRRIDSSSSVEGATAMRGRTRGANGQRSGTAAPVVEESTPLLRGVHRRAGGENDDDGAASVASVASSSIASARALVMPSFFRSLSRSLIPSETEIIDLGVAGIGGLHTRSGDSASADNYSYDGSDGFDGEYDESFEDECYGRADDGISGGEEDGGVNRSGEYSEGVSFDSSGGGGGSGSPGRALKSPMPHQHPHKHQHQHHHVLRVRRSLRRRIFLFLTEPQTSIASAAFFVILIVSITLSNVLMMLQTMSSFQFTPPDCVICGGSNEYYSTNDDVFYPDYVLTDMVNLTIPCVCPPIPKPEIVLMEDWTIWFFTVEWILRVVCFEPAPTEAGGGKRMKFTQWLSYLTEWGTVLDALAIFPYYIERYEQTNGLLSLRLLRLFRVFQLLRLGQYNTTFTSLVNVLGEALLAFNLLIIVLVFGAAFFGSMIYWLEKGVWKYTEYTEPPSFAYMRTAVDGVSEEPSPFTSIPASFWWFIVTATTVGYGDTYPTSFGGKCVAGLAMLMGVLVIAFPVSVFSDLWSKELKRAGLFQELGSEGKSIPEMSDRSTEMVEPRKPVKDADGGTTDPIRMCGEHDSTSSGRENPMLSTIDVETIVSHLKRIDESQGEIRKILDKYQQRK